MKPTLLRRAVTALTALAVTTAVTTAHAQQYVFGGVANVATGLEGNGHANGGPRPARTRLRLGVDFHVDEYPQDTFGVALLADVVPRTAFGVDVRYIRKLSPKFELSAGGIGYLAPATLFGPSVDLWYRIPIGKSLAFVVGPEFNVFVAGSDLPDGTVIWQGLIQLGIHADL